MPIVHTLSVALLVPITCTCLFHWVLLRFCEAVSWCLAFHFIAVGVSPPWTTGCHWLIQVTLAETQEAGKRQVAGHADEEKG